MSQQSARPNQIIRLFMRRQPCHLFSRRNNRHRCLASSSSSTSSATKTNTKASVQRMRDLMKPHHEDFDGFSSSSSCLEEANSVWETLWNEGITPWDLGRPTDVLISELEYHKLRPIKSLIPGCGAGYDVISLARYLDMNCEDNKDRQVPPKKVVVGLDISLTSLRHAQNVIQNSIERDGPLYHNNIRIELYKGDFFQPPSTWDFVFGTGQNLDSNSSAPPDFDFVFDYTFFCALPPALRNQWGYQMNQLLLKEDQEEEFDHQDGDDGRLLTLMFPYTYKTESNKPKIGPPYQVSYKNYQDVLSSQGLELETPLPYASPDSPPSRQGQEVIGWWRHNNSLETELTT